MNKYEKNYRKKFPICTLTLGNLECCGYLYMNNERVTVVINNICEDTYLGPLKNKREKHIEPEADIMIFPTRKVKNICIVGQF